MDRSGRAGARRERQRGNIEELPSGALRVRVYAGTDAITKKRLDLTEIVPAGPDMWDEAEEVRVRLVGQVRRNRHPRTKATLDELIDKYLDQFDGAEKTISDHRLNMRLHVSPFIGSKSAASIDTEMLDSLYAEARRCRLHCGREAGRIDHRTRVSHTCDHRCRPHSCTPLGASTIRHIHYLLQGAFNKGVVWKWVSDNPADNATPPSAPKPNPQPPSPEDAARLLKEAFRDFMWGVCVWLVAVTGTRRAEPCALRFSQLDLVRGTLPLKPSQTKSDKQRRITLDPQTTALLSDYRDLCRAQIEALGFQWDEDCFVFSDAQDHSVPWKPASVGQRYIRMAGRLGMNTSIHKLRHYSASELILAGVDVRTVAGRLGHNDGGATTLKVYSAWFDERDQRAAAQLQARLPEVSQLALTLIERAKDDPRSPYEKIAAAMRRQILDGEIVDVVPSMKEIVLASGVSVGTAQRAVSLLEQWGLVETAKGKRTRVIWDRGDCEQHDGPNPSVTSAARPAVNPEQGPAASEAGPRPETGVRLLDFALLKMGTLVKKFTAQADPDNPAHLRQLLTAAVRRDGGDVADYELDVHLSGSEDLLTTFVLLAEAG